MPRPRRPRAIFAALAAFLAIGVALPAQAADDAQAWGSVIATRPVKGKLFLWLETQARAIDVVGGGSQIIVRPAIGARIACDAHAVLGYAYIRTDPETGRTTNEHRLWQQVQFALLRTSAGAPLVLSRKRLEPRGIEGRNDIGWKLRRFVRL